MSKKGFYHTGRGNPREKTGRGGVLLTYDFSGGKRLNKYDSKNIRENMIKYIRDLMKEFNFPGMTHSNAEVLPGTGKAKIILRFRSVMPGGNVLEKLDKGLKNCEYLDNDFKEFYCDPGYKSVVSSQTGELVEIEKEGEPPLDEDYLPENDLGEESTDVEKTIIHRHG